MVHVQLFPMKKTPKLPIVTMARSLDALVLLVAAISTTAKPVQDDALPPSSESGEGSMMLLSFDHQGQGQGWPVNPAELALPFSPLSGAIADGVMDGHVSALQLQPDGGQLLPPSHGEDVARERRSGACVVQT